MGRRNSNYMGTDPQLKGNNTGFKLFYLLQIWTSNSALNISVLPFTSSILCDGDINFSLSSRSYGEIIIIFYKKHWKFICKVSFGNRMINLWINNFISQRKKDKSEKKNLIYKSQTLAFIVHLLDLSWKGRLKTFFDGNF